MIDDINVSEYKYRGAVIGEQTFDDDIIRLAEGLVLQKSRLLNVTNIYGCAFGFVPVLN